MITNKKSWQGFTLITSLMLLVLLTGISIGLLMMVDTESRAGGHDVENSMAFRSAEGAIELMTSNLANLYSTVQAPSALQISNLNSNRITNDPMVTYPEWTLTARTNPLTGAPAVQFRQISSGPDQGLYGQVLPIDLAVSAQRNLGDNVRMLRTVEVALIPVFQFGVFSDSDLAFFSSPQLDFNGRVHTNGDLYLGVSSGSTLTFHDKVTAYGNVIRNVLPNTLNPSSSYNNDGTVDLPTASGGCDNAQPACRPIAISEASVVLGPTSAQNAGWPSLSKSTYNGWVLDGNYGNPGGTGVKPLTLPFVSNGARPFEIIRRPPKVAGAATAADPSRLGNLAQIRVLLSDNPADLHLQGWNGDPTQDIELCSLVPGGLLAAGCGWAQNGVVVNGNTYYFGNANNDCTGGKGCEVAATQIKPASFHGAAFPAGVNEWPAIDGYLLVEVKWADGAWHGVTKEWLGLGFARGLAVPTAPATNALADHRNALMFFQIQADRNGDGQITTAGDISNTVIGANSQYNWFPINLYDTREGEVRDWATGAAPGGANTCSPNGIMNAVELNVGNLRNWLNGTIAGTGNQVDNAAQNGYILYFSDRRGMAADPNAAPVDLQGEYGFEDVINSASGNAGTPDQVPEAAVSIQGQNFSPEDTNQNNRLDTYGAANVGIAYGINTAIDPFTTRIASCYTVGRKNRVTGARHVLKLVDGSLGNVPTKPTNPPTGGFTVAAENPVYIQGDYNSSSADPTWLTPTAAEPAHAAASVIADTVTLLSNSWQDAGYQIAPGGPTATGSLLHPTDATLYRPATTTYYRVAVAAGKTIAFPHPGFTLSTTYYGTEGGVHNFLRFLEDWSNDNLWYKGSLVSMYYSTYNTGTFKCCNYVVYKPPVRRYNFDPLFTTYTNLPPGTPTFRDINNLTYRQDFTPH